MTLFGTRAKPEPEEEQTEGVPEYVQQVLLRREYPDPDTQPREFRHVQELMATTSPVDGSYVRPDKSGMAELWRKHREQLMARWEREGYANQPGNWPTPFGQHFYDRDRDNEVDPRLAVGRIRGK